jgi:hypothetical protein
VSFDATIAGNVDDFNQTAYKMALGEILGMSPEYISLVVTAASVRVVATIRVIGDGETDALTAASGIVATLSSLDAAEMSTRLQVAVERVAPAELVEVILPAPAPPPAAPLTDPSFGKRTAGAGLIAGVAVGLFVLALTALAAAYFCVYKRSGKGSVEKVFTRQSDMPERASGEPGRLAPDVTVPKSQFTEAAAYPPNKKPDPPPASGEVAVLDGARVQGGTARLIRSKDQPAAKPAEPAPNVPGPLKSPAAPQTKKTEHTPVSNIRSDASIRKLDDDVEPIPTIALVVTPTSLPPLPSDLAEVEEEPMSKRMTESTSCPKLPAIKPRPTSGLPSASETIPVPRRGGLDAVPLGKIAVPPVDSKDESAETTTPVSESRKSSSGRHSNSKPGSRPSSGGIPVSPIALLGRLSDRASRVHPTDATSADEEAASSPASSSDEASPGISPPSNRLSFGSRNSSNKVRPAPSFLGDDA